MEIIYLLIPISLLLVLVIGLIFFWAIRSGQYDDLERPKHQLLMDDDTSFENEERKEEQGTGS